MTTSVALEVGKKSVFATAVEWPGWCRRGRNREDALESLMTYAPRYGLIAGLGFVAQDLLVVDEVAGNATTDFGAPAISTPFVNVALTPGDRQRFITVLESSWAHFDEVVRRSSPALRRGPRSGGRDRDDVAGHVREAERAYCAKVGRRVAIRTPWEQQRTAIVNALLDPSETAEWPFAYAVHRITWHVVDHLWEIEDRQT